MNSAWALVKDTAPRPRKFANISNQMDVLSVPQPGENVDVAWYQDGTEFDYSIDTVEELHGFSYLSGLGVTFGKRTINLEANIDINSTTSWVSGDTNKFRQVRLGENSRRIQERP